jgi:hypothetical protein
MTVIDLSDLAATRGGSQPLRGYLASPIGPGPHPGVVLIHEIFGIDDVMRGHADRLAGLGYLTLAVDLFSAGGAVQCLVSSMTAMIRGRGRAFADIEAARDYLSASTVCTGKIGVVGFCIRSRPIRPRPKWALPLPTCARTRCRNRAPSSLDHATGLLAPRDVAPTASEASSSAS